MKKALLIVIATFCLSGCLMVHGQSVCAPTPTVTVLQWPEEPARHLSQDATVHEALTASAATIKNLEQTLREQQSLIKQAGVAK